MQLLLLVVYLILQEDLADKMSGLIHCIGPINARLLFIDTFFQTQAREWFGIDRYRLDKFMMVRCLLSVLVVSELSN